MKFWKKQRKSALTGREPGGLPAAALSAAAWGAEIEGFLREREAFCVNAISRFYSGIINEVWAAKMPCPDAAKPENNVRGLLLYGKGLLFPVFHFSPAMTEKFLLEDMPLPSFFPSVLKSGPLHCAQGLAGDMDMLETALGKKGIFPSSRYDYELRSLDYSRVSFLKTPWGMDGPPGLVIRKAETSDADGLFPLQAGYEQEEVLPRGAEFNPGLCRRGLEYLLAGNLVLAAELDGRLTGKININAQSLNFFQIGGVYVLPEYRGLGIAKAMTAALIREFALIKSRYSLFVKKANAPALRVYESLGFKKNGDYRISYF